MGFMTVSFGSEWDLSIPTVTGPAARPLSVVLPMPKAGVADVSWVYWGEDRHEHSGDR